MSQAPRIDTSAPLQFVINERSGAGDAQSRREAIEAALQAAGRCGELHFCGRGDVERLARDAAAKARDAHSAVVVVGGDGTLNTVAQSVHRSGCVLGLIPQGTFNYFARTHGIPTELDAAARFVLAARPTAVQVGALNDRLFLVNASLGLYPELLQDREAFKSRFGRNRVVALAAAFVTLMRSQRRLRLSIERAGAKREVRALTLFVGNNRLQLQQVGLAPPSAGSQAREDGGLTAVILRPVGTGRMFALMVRGAMGTLGEADDLEHFEFDQLVVKPTFAYARPAVKVAFDGEIAEMHSPLSFRVLDEPLWLLKSLPSAAAEPVT